MAVDTSGSMKPYWPAVRDSILGFIDSLPVGDHVSVILFDTRATNSRILPRTIDPHSAADLRREFELLPPPSGARTDLGYALRAVVNEIARPEAHRLQFVFLFSDFVHEPASDSEFGSRDADTPAWNDLAKRAREVLGQRLVQSFALMLPMSAEAGRDLGLVRAVLGQVEVVPVNASTLREWFTRRRDEMQRDKLRALLNHELKLGWSVDARRVGNSDDLVFLSHTSKLPLTVQLTSCSSPGTEVSINKMSPILVPPGGQVTVPLGIRYPARGSALTRLLTTRMTSASPVTLSVRGNVELKPADELAILGVTSTYPVDATLRRTLAVGHPGTPLAAQLGLLAVIVGLLWLTWQTWLRPRASVSRAFRTVVIQADGSHETLDVPRSSGVSVVVGNISGATVRSQAPAPAFSVVVVSRKPNFPFIRPKRGFYTYCQDGDISYRSKRWDATARSWTESDLPLPAELRKSIAVGYQTTLFVRGGGRTLTIELCR